MNASLTTRIFFASLFLIAGFTAFEQVQTGMETRMGHVSSCIDGLGTSGQSAGCNQIG